MFCDAGSSGRLKAVIYRARKRDSPFSSATATLQRKEEQI